MEYKTLDEIRDVAVIQPSWLGSHPLTKCERLERWAEVLERQGGRRLKTLFEIEYLSRAERAALRANDSPLSVAFADARLRGEGLADDTVGEAIAFFGVIHVARGLRANPVPALSSCGSLLDISYGDIGNRPAVYAIGR